MTWPCFNVTPSLSIVYNLSFNLNLKIPLNVDFLLFKTSFDLLVLLHLSNIVYIIASNKDDLPDAFAANNPITSDNLEKSTLFFSPYENILSNSNDTGYHVTFLTDSKTGSLEFIVLLICLIASNSFLLESG